MNRLSPLLAIAVVLAAAVPTHAMADDFDGAGTLVGIPFDGPFEVVEEARQTGANGPVWVRWYDATFDECVEAFTEVYAGDSQLAEDWSLSGYGRNAATGAWNFGLLFRSEALYRMEVHDDGGGCRVEVDSSALGLVGGYYRMPWPALQPVGTAPLRIDPMVPNRIFPADP